jgi:hypothetical protein
MVRGWLSGHQLPDFPAPGQSSGTPDSDVRPVWLHAAAKAHTRTKCRLNADAQIQKRLRRAARP